MCKLWSSIAFGTIELCITPAINMKNEIPLPDETHKNHIEETPAQWQHIIVEIQLRETQSEFQRIA